MKYFKYILCAVVLVILCTVGYLAFKYNMFSSVDNFKAVIEGAGFWGPLLFVVVQTISVIILFLPCMLGYPVGVMCFGPLVGFLLNYISALLGGMFIYLLTHKYGVEFVKEHTSKKVLEKYEKLKDNTSKCEKFLAIALIFPCFPDNAISYVVSLSDMSFKRYMLISILCKPWQLIAYSWGWSFVLNKLVDFLNVTV